MKTSYYTTAYGIHKLDEDTGKVIWSMNGQQIDEMKKIMNELTQWYDDPDKFGSDLADLAQKAKDVMSTQEEKHVFSEHVIWLMLDGAKTTGNYLEGLQYHGEEYTHEEYANAENFLNWLVKNNLNIGYGNAQEMIDKWLDEVPGKES